MTSWTNQAPTTSTDSYLLKEDTDYLLQENGDYIVLSYGQNWTNQAINSSSWTNSAIS